MEYLDDGNAAPRYSEKPLTDGEGWDAEPEGVRRCREMEGNGLPCLSNPHSPNQYHHTRTRNPHSVVGRRRIVTPKYMLELFTSIGINSLCLKDLHLPWTAGLQPPVTAMSLTELDLQRIMNNTKLRADINYDADLHFKPNLEGENGRKKCDEAKEYWKALAVELLLYRALCSEGDFGQLPSFAPITVDDQERIFTSRLPPMFETIRAILQSLVPEQERSFMDERFDGPLLMQQIQRGCLDFKNLSTWLAQVLKRHCAPMRDSMVDGMLERISRGADNVEVLVDGLKDLFGILEVMKLVNTIL